MSTDAINKYSNNINTLYGENLYRKTETENSSQTGGPSRTDGKSTAATGSTVSTVDVVELSQTSGFFQKLKQLEATDPETYNELFDKLGKKLDSALGYADQVLSEINQRLSKGEEISDILN